MNEGLVIWITGLPGSGKSTIANALKKLNPEFIILNMDEMRRFVTPRPTYSEVERDIVYRAIVYLSKILSDIGSNVIIDATGNLRKWRTLARKKIKRYIEVYLRCPLSICIEREEKRIKKYGAPKNIYKKASKGWPIPGISAPYEEPINPEIVIDTAKLSIKESAEIINDRIKEINLLKK
jgi:adenylylsulfate kinase